MKYAETIHALADHLVADIYKIEKSNFYIIQFFEVVDNSKKYHGKKVRAMLNECGLQVLKEEIREKLFQEVFQHNKNYH